MAIETLSVDIRSLERAADDMEICAENIKNQMDIIFESVDKLSSAWCGDAASKYIRRFDEWKDDSKKMMFMMKRYAGDLRTMAANYRGIREANETLTSGLRNDVLK